jgi:hypothetical protein
MTPSMLLKLSSRVYEVRDKVVLVSLFCFFLSVMLMVAQFIVGAYSGVLFLPMWLAMGAATAGVQLLVVTVWYPPSTREKSTNFAVCCLRVIAAPVFTVLLLLAVALTVVGAVFIVARPLIT